MKPEVLTYLICMNSCYLEHRLKSILLPPACYLFGLVRHNRLILAASNPIIQEQDWLVAIALQPSQLPALKVCLKQSRSIFWHSESSILDDCPCVLN
jgi:NhaP-type Na+/H+ and K+/H+ antiporter